MVVFVGFLDMLVSIYKTTNIPGLSSPSNIILMQYFEYSKG